ncbi:hypothetical protein [Paraburkholderia tagetis]|uniref:Uncharacterized protein n=1 Tax=Paraburkholderia tagetis TaxID=2913261 RepID=A0A9X1UD54_9BURK|nr:hypothetical protein [Paraburkholderia tagetis]MCG5072264.1 hypothetical protein [Paraburkholderia tagetis]
MRFEEVLPALREGKCARQEGHRFPWAYMKMIDGALHWCNFGPYREPFKAHDLRMEELLADNWQVVDEAEQRAAAPTGTHFCGRRGVDDGSKPDYFHNLGGEERCSYCGSVSGDSFLAFIEAGGEVGPTDKSYKAYLHGNDAVRAPGLKFYFQHLSPEQRTRFIALLNERKVKIGMPGHFYVLPYFVTREV